MSIKRLQMAATAGNSDSTFTVPGNTSYRILYGQILLTTGATAGDRRVVLQVLDSADSLVIDFHCGAVVAASQTDQHHEFMQGIYRETSFSGGAIQVPIGQDIILPPDWKLNLTISGGLAEDSYSGDIMVDAK